jgi:hypothetical protein
MRAMLKHGEQGKGWWRTAWFFPFYSGRGGGQPIVKAEELSALMG